MSPQRFQELQILLGCETYLCGDRRSSSKLSIKASRGYTVLKIEAMCVPRRSSTSRHCPHAILRSALWCAASRPSAAQPLSRSSCIRLKALLILGTQQCAACALGILNKLSFVKASGTKAVRRCHSLLAMHTPGRQSISRQHDTLRGHAATAANTVPATSAHPVASRTVSPVRRRVTQGATTVVDGCRRI